MDAEAAHEWQVNLVYRGTYGHAHRRLERERMGPNDEGRDPAALLRRLREHVAREMGDHHEMHEAIEDGIRDAMEGRRPRW